MKIISSSVNLLPSSRPCRSPRMAKSATDRLSSKAWSAYVYGIQIAQWLTFYSPQTGLLLCSQTSLVYFATIAKRYSERVVNGRSSTDDDSILISKFAIYPAILLSLIYMFLSRYSLLDTSLWRREQWKASSPPDDVPDGWLQTDLTTGLTDDEVEARRKVYGWNELTSGRRDWSYLLQRQLIWPDAAANFSLMASNPVLGLCHPLTFIDWRAHSSVFS